MIKAGVFSNNERALLNNPVQESISNQNNS
jgi:hypothetical protein